MTKGSCWSLILLIRFSLHAVSPLPAIGDRSAPKPSVPPWHCFSPHRGIINMSAPYIFHVVCFKIVKEARKDILGERKKR